ncbi:MAG: DUF167 domain-containing protein [Lentisphaeria bacterium]|nr:DUF167 domain-containing protein [Lentisphaeria bacterium]
MAKLSLTAFKRDGDATTITLHLQPGAKRSQVCGMYGDAVKLAIQAPPVDGKANAALRTFIANRLKIPTTSVTLVSGATGRDKRIRVAGVTPDQALTALETQ